MLVLQVTGGRLRIANRLIGYYWRNISAYKRERGLGIRDAKLFNQALLAKQCWRLLNCPDLLISRILLSKDRSKESLINVKVHPGSSWVWKSILFGRDLIARHIAWRVGHGSSV